MASVHVLSMSDEHSKRYPPLHWLNRAEEAWEMARVIKDAEARNQMETIAGPYESLVEFAHRLSRGAETYPLPD